MVTVCGSCGLVFCAQGWLGAQAEGPEVAVVMAAWDWGGGLP